ncbi:MAG: DUF2238 domain-containing protein [Phycisphaerales bacterium]|nr:DUF2238 domain-containing protein [Phycisphaerales bacterium]
MTRAFQRIMAFTLLYLIVFGYLAIRAGGTEFIFYSICMVIFITLVLVVHRAVRLSNGVLLALSIWGFLHMAGGTVRPPWLDGEVIYAWQIIPSVLRYDQMTHCFGFAAATMTCWQGLSRALRRPAQPTVGLVFLAALMGMGLGTINEMIEFAATQIDPENGVGDYTNNALDLVFNAIGSTIAAIWIFVRPPRR